MSCLEPFQQETIVAPSISCLPLRSIGCTRDNWIIGTGIRYWLSVLVCSRKVHMFCLRLADSVSRQVVGERLKSISTQSLASSTNTTVILKLNPRLKSMTFWMEFWVRCLSKVESMKKQRWSKCLSVSILPLWTFLMETFRMLAPSFEKFKSTSRQTLLQPTILQRVRFSVTKRDGPLTF